MLSWILQNQRYQCETILCYNTTQSLTPEFCIENNNAWNQGLWNRIEKEQSAPRMHLIISGNLTEIHWGQSSALSSPVLSPVLPHPQPCPPHPQPFPPSSSALSSPSSALSSPILSPILPCPQPCHQQVLSILLVLHPGSLSNPPSSLQIHHHLQRVASVTSFLGLCNRHLMVGLHLRGYFDVSTRLPWSAQIKHNFWVCLDEITTGFLWTQGSRHSP